MPRFGKTCVSKLLDYFGNRLPTPLSSLNPIFLPSHFAKECLDHLQKITHIYFSILNIYRVHNRFSYSTLGRLVQVLVPFEDLTPFPPFLENLDF